MSSPEPFSETLSDTAERASEYLRGIRERRVYPTADAIDGLKALGGPLPATGANPSQILTWLDDSASPARIASTAGRYFGFVIGGTIPGALVESG